MFGTASTLVMCFVFVVFALIQTIPQVWCVISQRGDFCGLVDVTLHLFFFFHSGASGGVASEKRTIAPQFVPVTQLVLLTKKVYIEKLGM